MSAIVELPVTGHANCNEDVARFLRRMADNVEAGEYGQIRQLITIIESGGQLETWVAGGPCDNARIAGLMSMAQLKFINL